MPPYSCYLVSDTLMPNICSELCGWQVLVTPWHWQGWAQEMQRWSPPLGPRKKSKVLQDPTPSPLPQLSQPPPGTRLDLRLNHWQLLKSGVTCRPLHMQFFLLESSFLPWASAARALRLAQIPAPVGRNPQTTCALSPPLMRILQRRFVAHRIKSKFCEGPLQESRTHNSGIVWSLDSEDRTDWVKTPALPLPAGRSWAS